MKQIGTAEKMKLELTTNGSWLKGREGSGGEEEREGCEGGDWKKKGKKRRKRKKKRSGDRVDVQEQQRKLGER